MDREAEGTTPLMLSVELKRLREQRYYRAIQSDPMRKIAYLARKRKDAQRRDERNPRWKDPLTGKWQRGLPKDTLPRCDEQGLPLLLRLDLRE